MIEGIYDGKVYHGRYMTEGKGRNTFCGFCVGRSLVSISGITGSSFLARKDKEGERRWKKRKERK
jgi:hypothetical protein